MIHLLRFINAEINGKKHNIVQVFNAYISMFDGIVPGISEQLKFSCTEHFLSTFPAINSQHWHAIENYVHLEIAVRFICASITSL